MTARVSNAGAPTAAQLRALKRRDPLLGRRMRELPKFPCFPTLAHARMGQFEYLTRAIVYQQLSTKAAASIWSRVRALGPGGRVLRADHIPMLSDEQLRGAGLSRSKVLSVRDLSRHFVDGALPVRNCARLENEAIIERLTPVRGIGEWSAQMFLIFKLGRLDVMPTTDLGVQEGLRRLDGLSERPTPNELLERSETWKPLSSVAAWYLWRMTEVETP